MILWTRYHPKPCPRKYEQLTVFWTRVLTCQASSVSTWGYSTPLSWILRRRRKVIAHAKSKPVGFPDMTVVVVDCYSEITTRFGINCTTACLGNWEIVEKRVRAARALKLMFYWASFPNQVADLDNFWQGHSLLSVEAMAKAAPSYLAYLSNNVALKSS